MNKTAIRLLAEYFTGPDVGHNSVGMAMPYGTLAHFRERAERYFALREAFSVTGYLSTEQAEAAISNTLSGVPQ